MHETQAARGPETITVNLQDLESAAQAGIISTAQSRLLWSRWSGRDVVSDVTTARRAPVHGPGFSFTNTLYYLGGMVAIGAMTLFMTLGWQAFGAWGLLGISVAYFLACLKVADHLKTRELPIPAGILATLAVCLVPLKSGAPSAALAFGHRVAQSSTRPTTRTSTGAGSRWSSPRWPPGW